MSYPYKPRGFAYLKLHDPERQKELASKGGKSAHDKGVAHKWTPEEAREAGIKGGIVTGKKAWEKRSDAIREAIESKDEPNR